MKTGSYIFLAVLVSVLLFVIGVRYGTRVEKTNKLTDYILKNTSPTPSPAVTAGYELKNYKNLLCGIQFLYPADFYVNETASREASFGKGGYEPINIACDTGNFMSEVLSDDKTATAEVTFKNKKIKGEYSPEADKKDPYIVFKTVNPINGKTVYFNIEMKLYNLFERTFEFTAK